MAITVVRPDRGGSPITDNVGAGDRDTAEVNLPPRTTPPVPLGDRSVRIPFGETTGKTIPDLATRAGKYAGWDLQGEWAARTVSAGSGGGMSGYLLSDLSGITFDAGQQFLWCTGYASENDGGQGWLVRVTDAVELAADGVDGDSVRWRFTPYGQTLCPEMCGAKGDAVLEPNTYTDWNQQVRTTLDVTNTPTDDTAAFVKFFDLLNYWHSFKAALTPGRNYFFAPIARTSLAFVTKNVTLHDGRTCSGRFIMTTTPVPLAVCWDGFEFHGTGATLICDGDFNLTASDYLAPYRLKDTMMPFNLWKCRNGVFQGIVADGGWRFQTTDTGGSGECLSYAFNAAAVANITWNDCILFDFAQDGFAIGHRNLNVNPITGAVLTSVEGYPEPDQSTASVYNPDGRSQNLTFNNCVIGPCRRQGMSPIGVGGRDLANIYPGMTVNGGMTRDIGRFIGTAPKWLTGNSTDGSTKWQWRGYPPRLAFDWEPQRQGPYQVDDVKINNHRMIGCVGGFAGAPGDWGLNRVEQSIPAADVNATTNIFTKTGLTLPGCYAGQIPCKVRIWSDGTLPGGTELYTDYFLAKLSSSTFYMCASYEDAVAVPPVPINITSAGTGTHWFVYHDSHPNVGTVDLNNCTGIHPWDGSLAPFQMTSERFTITGGVYENKAGTGYFGPSQANREDTTFKGVEFRSVRYLLDVDSYVPKSGVTFENGGQLVTFTNHAIGKYEYTPIRFKSGGVLPPEVERNRTYYATRVGNNTFNISASIPEAKDGSYITFSSAGTGTHVFWKFNLSKFSVTDNRFKLTPRDLSFDAALDVDTSGNRIHIPMSLNSDGIANAEAFRLRHFIEADPGTAPGGLTAVSTTYYAFVDPNEPDWVYLASTSANANARTAIDLTSVGSGRFYLAPTSSIKVGDILDVDCDFERNTVIVAREALQTYGGTQQVWSIVGASTVGNNRYETDLRDSEGTFQVYYAGNRSSLGGEIYWPPEAFAATNLTTEVNFTSPKFFTYTGTLNPGSVAPGAVEGFTVSVPGLLTTDRCFVEMQITSSYPSLVVQRAYCATNGTLTIALANTDSSGPSLDAPSSAFTLLGVRIG